MSINTESEFQLTIKNTNTESYKVEDIGNFNSLLKKNPKYGIPKISSESVDNRENNVKSNKNDDLEKCEKSLKKEQSEEENGNVLFIPFKKSSTHPEIVYDKKRNSFKVSNKQLIEVHKNLLTSVFI